MIYEVNNNIKIWQKFNPITLAFDNSSTDTEVMLAKFGMDKKRISINDRWFDILSSSELYRMRNKRDGYYRVIYIQINHESGEYYIGKANRPKWSELNRYQGSGLKFKNKLKKNNKAFSRYYIAVCNTAEETEKLEASIVTNELIKDENCLNLITGGAGVTKRPTSEERKLRASEYMKNNPEQYQPMLKAARKAFLSGGSAALDARSKRIKQVMSSEKYRTMSRERIKKWKEENPEEYKKARQKNREKIKTKEVQAKRQASLEKWRQENPEEYEKWQEKLIDSRTSPEANKKRSESIKKFNQENPAKAHENALKRSKAAAAIHSKSVLMIDVTTGEALKKFDSARDAARWLAEKGITNSKNPASSISAVCNGKRNKAFGYSWIFLQKHGLEEGKQLSFVNKIMC